MTRRASTPGPRDPPARPPPGAAGTPRTRSGPIAAQYTCQPITAHLDQVVLAHAGHHALRQRVALHDRALVVVCRHLQPNIFSVTNIFCLQPAHPGVGSVDGGHEAALGDGPHGEAAVIQAAVDPEK